MSVTHTTSIEQLWDMPEKPGVRYELADGELIEVPGAGYAHSLISGLLYRLLYQFVVDSDLGVILHDGITFILRFDPPWARIPDVSFIAAANVPDGDPPEGFWPSAPDLAVEVVSPHEWADDVQVKVDEYLAAGTQTVWVLWPREQMVTVHGHGEPVSRLKASETLGDGALLPGFSVQVADLFSIQL
jgi:Uma2 family endonuclease